MFTRLIWKEFRMFWPIWLCVAVVAVSLQWLVFDQIYDNSGKVGERLMVVFAWASLYACVVGSASFASEREGNTLGFLDALGLGRGRLWSAKVAFSAATSLLLVLVIAVLIVPSASLLGTDGSGERLLYLVAYGLALMFSTLFWSLFWSSWKASPLTAAVLTIFSVLLMVLAIPLRVLDQMPDVQLMPIIQVGLGIASAAFVGSFLVITRGQPTPRIPRVRVRLESPPPAASARPGTTYRLIWICLRENGVIWLGGLPTERERVRRGAQAEFLAQLMLASHRPSQLRELDRLSEWHYLKAGLPQATIEIGRLRMMLKNTPLLRLLPSADQVVRLAAEREATRRALDFALGLGSWKLKHGGYPDSLAELTTLPGVGTLPDDPFSERPFFYGPDNSSGEPAGMGGMAGMMSSAPPEPLAPNPTQNQGRRVLISVGIDGRFGHDDLVFVLP